jgi:hypothetical protein
VAKPADVVLVAAKGLKHKPVLHLGNAAKAKLPPGAQPLDGTGQKVVPALTRNWNSRAKDDLGDAGDWRGCCEAPPRNHARDG